MSSGDLKTSMLNVLGALMSVDNAARKAAETYFSEQLAADAYVDSLSLSFSLSHPW